MLNAIVPVWATETAEHTSRGQFIAIEFTLNIFGVVVAYWLELYWNPRRYSWEPSANMGLVVSLSLTVVTLLFDGGSLSVSKSFRFCCYSQSAGSFQNPQDGLSSRAAMKKAYTFSQGFVATIQKV